jgi:hypothetical protein
MSSLTVVLFASFDALLKQTAASHGLSIESVVKYGTQPISCMEGLSRIKLRPFESEISTLTRRGD